MVANIKRYAVLLLLFLKSDFYMQTAYASNFVISTLAKILRVGIVMVSYHTLVVSVPNIPSWSTPELYILAATFYVTDLVASIFFHRNLLYHLPREIREGTFDRTLQLPVPQLFYTAFQRIDAGDFFAVVPFAAFWVYVVQHFSLDLTFSAVVGYSVMVCNAIVFIFALVLLTGSSAFWFQRGDGFGRLLDNVTGAARFPFAVFPQAFQFVVFFIVPVALLATIPTQVLLGKAQMSQVLYSLVFTAVLLCIAVAVWRKGIRVYQSASS